MKQAFTFNTDDPLSISYEDKNSFIVIHGGLPDKYDNLTVTIRLVNKENQERSFRDRVNFYASEELELLKENAIGKLFFQEEKLDKSLELFLQCTEQFRQSERKRKIQQADIQITDNTGTINQKEIQSAQKYLESKNLYTNLKSHLLEIGIVGEENNVMLLFLIMTSRLLANPLNALLISKTGSGKSELMEKVAKLIPTKDTLEITGITNKALFHYENELSNKVLLLQDMTNIEKDITQQLQELISKKKLSRLVSEKTKHGNYQSVLKSVHGPICLIGASTEDVYLDLSNRSVLLYLDESKEQDKRIMERQRQQVAGLLDYKKENTTIQKLRNVQSLLKSYTIQNPYASQLQLPEAVLTKRRANTQYLQLINVITLLHQFQRKTAMRNGQEVLITDMEDIRIANGLIKTLLMNKSDLLQSGERKFYERLKGVFTKKDSNFSTSEVCKLLRTPLSSVKRYLKNLKEKGYVQIIGGDRYKDGYTYKLQDDTDLENIHNQIENLLSGTITNITEVAQ